MPMFRKKPVVIEAMQWGGSVESAKAIEAWSGGRAVCREYEHGIFIETLEGRMTARARDWIIKGVHGEYYGDYILDSAREDAVFRYLSRRGGVKHWPYGNLSNVSRVA